MNRVVIHETASLPRSWPGLLFFAAMLTVTAAIFSGWFRSERRPFNMGPDTRFNGPYAIADVGGTLAINGQGPVVGKVWEVIATRERELADAPFERSDAGIRVAGFLLRDRNPTAEEISLLEPALYRDESGPMSSRPGVAWNTHVMTETVARSQPVGLLSGLAAGASVFIVAGVLFRALFVEVKLDDDHEALLGWGAVGVGLLWSVLAWTITPTFSVDPSNGPQGNGLILSFDLSPRPDGTLVISQVNATEIGVYPGTGAATHEVRYEHDYKMPRSAVVLPVYEARTDSVTVKENGVLVPPERVGAVLDRVVTSPLAQDATFRSMAIDGPHVRIGIAWKGVVANLARLGGLIAMGAALMMAVRETAARRRQYAVGLCAGCGYPRSDEDPRAACPECGRAG